MPCGGFVGVGGEEVEVSDGADVGGREHHDEEQRADGGGEDRCDVAQEQVETRGGERQDDDVNGEQRGERGAEEFEGEGVGVLRSGP